MTNCDLSIIIDGPDRLYDAGDAISGRVLVDVSEPVKCNGLTLAQRWETHGRGNTDGSDRAVETLFVGEWEQPGQYEYAFEFEQPPGPVTYHGDYLNVDWYLEAAADIPWAFDPDARADYLATYTGSAENYQVGDAGALDRAGDQQPSFAGCLGVFGAISIVSGVFIFLVSLNAGELVGLPCGLVSLGIGVFTAWKGVTRYLADRKIGDVNVTVEPAVIHPEEQLVVDVEIVPPNPVVLSSITYDLMATEVVTRGSGTNKRTYRHDVFHEAKSHGREELDRGGDAYEFSEAFTIPADAAPSFDSGDDNELQWILETYVDLPYSPDWSTRNIIFVVPGERAERLEHDSDQAKPEEAGQEDWW